VGLADRNFVDANAPRPQCVGAGKLGAHVLLVQFLDRGTAATPTDKIGEPLRIERIVGQKV
jgi:hypothetical protein